MSRQVDPSDWMTQAEAARLRSVSRQAINHLVRMGRVRTLVVGRRVLVNVEDIKNYKPSKPGPKVSEEQPAARSQANGWITQAEAARQRDVTYQAITHFVKLGRLRTLDIAGAVLVNLEDLNRLKPRRTKRS
jgi:excisionase family DNA binding protein